MTNLSHARLTRRELVYGAAALSCFPAGAVRPALAGLKTTLVAAPGQVPIVGAPHPNTQVWCYNGTVPAPEIRARQGDRLRVEFKNRLPDETTVHWHGIRVPNAMDGVPHLTQQPVPPGGAFIYEFDLPDAGTFWFHPHLRSAEQVERGLSGALIVEERDPPAVDRDVVWLLDDWRLQRDASITPDFGSLQDITHAGRIGNTPTVNGRMREEFRVRAGERIRLRLINAANARIFALEFTGHSPRIVALDGHPVEPHEEERVILAPGQRADLILDAAAEPATRHAVVDRFYRGLEYRLLDLVYAAEPPLPAQKREVVALPANPLAEPDVGTAHRVEITFGGGMMSTLSDAVVDGQRMELRDMLRRGLAWTLNGHASSGHGHEPLLEVRRGQTCVLSLRNETAWYHPMHLHGHAFRVVARNGVPNPRHAWLDTVLVAPRETVEIAFLADNPGDWMFHCHILEHQSGGMMGTVRVS